MWKPIGFLLFLTSLATSAYAVPPVLNYAGQVSVDGEPFEGSGFFKFALLGAKGKISLWSNDGTSVGGTEPKSWVSVSVNGGLYSILLGNIAIDGMGAIDPAIFNENSGAKLRVWFSDGVNGFERLKPDRPFASVPYAFNSESSKSADSVKAGVISPAQLNDQILKYLKPEITLVPQAPGMVFKGQQVTLQAQAEGKFLQYQWLKNGKEIKGATNDRLVIKDVKKKLHDGNYSVVVSNDFGSVTTHSTPLVVDSTPTTHSVLSADNMEMIFCPPGTFTMGQASYEQTREVTLTHGFYLGKFEVSQKEWQDVMTGNKESISINPSQFGGKSDHPVERISWLETQVFLKRLNEREQSSGRLPEGWKYALPTEAEWEYACRAGTKTLYYFENDINSSYANYNWDAEWNTGSDLRKTSKVGQFKSNPWGFYDMYGNVAEWIQDWHDNYPNFSEINPVGPAISGAKGFRGGSWISNELRSSLRKYNSPSHKWNSLGFRVAFKPILIDTVKPEIQLKGYNLFTHEAGQAWVEPGVEAHDARDGNITDQIVVTGIVDMNRTGDYTLTYTVTDAAGNKDTKTRKVTVVGSHSVDLNATVAMNMIWCPPGTFTMGSPSKEAGRDTDREDEHNVSLTQGFYLGKYEVTQAQYEAVMTGNTETNSSGDVISATPSNWHGNPNRPVEMVSWEDIQVFLTRLNAQQSGNLPEGWSYVLPTESQWEYACRAGTTTAYSWGDSIASTNANYNWDGAWNTGSDFKQTCDVGQYSGNPWGFFDMHGNVWEWTADWLQVAYPSGNPVIDPKGPASGSFRIRRGGSWYYDSTGLRSAKRFGSLPGFLHNSLGFRISLQKSQ
jgi:formylglycine-generating enzyme required for sulfatase activity